MPATTACLLFVCPTALINGQTLISSQNPVLVHLLVHAYLPMLRPITQQEIPANPGSAMARGVPAPRVLRGMSCGKGSSFACNRMGATPVGQHGAKGGLDGQQFTLGLDPVGRHA